MTALYQPLAGDYPNAAQLATWVPIEIIKGGDQSFSSTIAFQNDAALFVTVPASVTFDCHLHMMFNSPAAAGLNTQFTAPAGAVMTGWTFLLPATPPAANMGPCGVTAGQAGIGTNGTNQVGDYWGTLVVGVTGGTFQFQWAQNTSNAGVTTMRAGSYLHLRQVA